MMKHMAKLNLLYNIAFAIPVALILMVPGRPHAQFNNGVPLGSNQHCGPYFSYYERKFNIPNALLHSIATIESGRFNNTTNSRDPWPWTVNAAGKGYYFNSKAEAVNFVRKKMAAGMESIDVGCMQINLRYHPDAFSNLNQAFEPMYNVAYAAEFLKRNYQSSRNWSRAVGIYHSGTAELGTPYAQKVLAIWRTKLNTTRQEFKQAAVQQPMPLPRRFSRTPLIVVQPKQAAPMAVANASSSSSASKAQEANTKALLARFGTKSVQEAVGESVTAHTAETAVLVD